MHGIYKYLAIRMGPLEALGHLARCLWMLLLLASTPCHSAPLQQQGMQAEAAGPITYTRIAGVDSGPGGALRWKRCVANCSCAHRSTPHCPVSMLESLCSSTPHCAGFNSNGWLKSCVSTSCGQTRKPSAGCDLYVGSAVVPGPWPSPSPSPSPYQPPGPPAPGPWYPHPPPPSPPPPRPLPPVSPPVPVPPLDDWHFPSEEATELRSAPQLRILQVHASSNESGTILFAEGTSKAGSPVLRRLSVGDSTASGWQLRSFIIGSNAVPGEPAPVLVLERDWPRWGVILFVQPGAHDPRGAALGRCSLVASPSSCFMIRKGVGHTSALSRPHYQLEAADPDYFVKARDLPGDWLKARMCNITADGEPTFESAARLLAPSRDYTMVGNPGAHTKFSVSPDGRITCANHSIFTAMEDANITSPLVIFDPRHHTEFWPKHNFSEYKSALVGRVSRAVSVSAWHMPAQKGFSMIAVPNTHRGIETGAVGARLDPAEILLRLEDVSTDVKAAKEHRGPAKFFGVQVCGLHSRYLCQNATESLRTLSPAEFYAHLLLHTRTWTDFHHPNSAGVSAGPLHLRVAGSEGTRLVDMSRAVISSATSMFLGQRPNYGDGSVYWSVTTHDAGSLPLESFALDRALLLWGHPHEAASHIEFYLNTYVRNSSGLTPANRAGMQRNQLWHKDGHGPAGSLDLKQWGCGHGPGGAVMPHNFQESLADYGRWLDLWVDVARAMEPRAGGIEWIRRTWSQIHLLTNYTMALHREALAAEHPFP
eukprot:SAG31_NODE_4225_length_3445_cov_1.903467_3_plen_763_part_01